MNTQQLQNELDFFQPYHTLTEQSTPFGQLFTCTIDTENPAFAEHRMDVFEYGYGVADMYEWEDLDVRTFVQNGFRFIQVRLHGIGMEFENHKVTRIQ